MTRIDRRQWLAILATLGAANALPEAARAVENGDVVPLSPRPPAASRATKLRVGVVINSYTVVMHAVAERLKLLNVDYEQVDFVRYADARTALVSGSLDVATLGPGDIAVALTQGIDQIIGLSGLGSAHRWVVVRKGVPIRGWQDLKGKRLGLPTGSDTWVRFAAKIWEEQLAYGDLNVINIQGSQQNSLQALRRGEVDAIVTWEPAESQAVMEGIAYWDKDLDFSTARATGPEIGMIAASRTTIRNKSEALRLFAWGYQNALNDLVADRDKLIAAVQAHTNIDDANLARSMTDNLKLGGFALDADQVRRHARIMFDLGILQKDVSEAAFEQFDPTIFTSVRAKS